jgi:hypothetical protein
MPGLAASPRRIHGFSGLPPFLFPGLLLPGLCAFVWRRTDTNASSCAVANRDDQLTLVESRIAGPDPDSPCVTYATLNEILWQSDPKAGRQVELIWHCEISLTSKCLRSL